MGTGWLSHVGEWASAWPAGLWRASWQGALCAALVWALTRAWPRMPASLRAGLWWLVALKFVVSLGGLRPVPLPVLPASLASLEVMGASAEAPGDVTVARSGAVIPERTSLEQGALSRAERPGQEAGVNPGALRFGGTRAEKTGQRGGALSGEAEHSDGSDSSGASREVTVSREAPRSEVPGHVATSRETSVPAEPSRGGVTGHVAMSGEAPISEGVAREGVASHVAMPGEAHGAQGAVRGGVTRSSELPAVTVVTHGPTVFPAATVTARSVPWGRVLAWVLFTAWAAGVLWQLRSHVKGWDSMRRLRGSARPVSHPVLEAEVEQLAAAAKLRRAPRLLVSESVASPLATGLVDPVVVLPAKAVRRLPVEALRMALAHELAHLRRGDLWLGWVPALAEALLFFHPLARRAAREYALAREEACDAEALRLTGAEPADYGELLIAFGVARGAGTAAALGASAHIHALHRRLSMLEHVDAVPAPSRRLLKAALTALGLAALVPFQVVAQESAAKDAKPSGASQAKSSAAPATSAAPAPAASAKDAKPSVAPATSATPAPAASAKSSAAPAPGFAANAAGLPVPPVPAAPAVAGAPPAPPAPATPRIAGTPPAPPVPATPRISGTPPVPAVPPAPRLAMAPAKPAVPRVAAVPPVPPVPPPFDGDEDGDSYVLLADNMAMMSGSSVDLNLAGMFKQPGKELLYVRRKGETFIIRDAATLKAVRTALEPSRELGKAQGELGGRQGELGGKQGELGAKQGELGMKQAELGMKQAELAHKRAGLNLEEMRLDSLPEADRKSREAELRKKEDALEQEEKALDKQREALEEQQEALGREQEKLGEQQEALGREQEKLGEQQEALSRESEKKVRGLIDEALRKGLGQPLPT